MRRREFIAALGGAVVCGSRAANRYVGDWVFQWRIAREIWVRRGGS